MFEYTALVDAPVQRFTSIVTGPNEDDEAVTVAVLAPAAPVVIPTSVAPAMLVPVAPDLDVPEPVLASPIVPEPAVPAQLAPSPVMPAPAVPGHRPSSSFRPALVALVAAGVTAMWWLRRDSHHR